MWIEEEGLVFVQCRDANRAPIEPCAEVAAHRPRFVWAARNASGEDWTLHSTACRHQDSQESSGDDKMVPYRVRARAPPQTPPDRSEPEDVPYASGHGEEEEERRREERRGGGREKRRCTICHMPSGPLGSPKMAHAPGRGMAPFCRHRTIPGCPDAYRRFSARYNPRLMRGGPPRRTEACARRPPRTARSGGSICVATLQKRGLSPLPTHQPPLTPLERPTLPTAQGLAQAEKPNSACKGASPAPSLKPSAAHGQIGRSPAEFARGGSSDQPQP